MKRATIVESRKGIYSAFPTMVTHKGYIYLYYRQGATSSAQVHGLHGVVNRMKVREDDYTKAHGEPKAGPVSKIGEERVVFAGENELDSIVAQIDESLFSLCTRDTVLGSHNTCFVSFGDEPEFYWREEVSLPGVNLHAFYGKPLKTPHGYVFTAYGEVNRDGLQRPLVLVTDTKRWGLLSYLPTMVKGNRLNECSLTRDGDSWLLFIREDDPPYGIWFSRSPDLQEWSAPEKLVSSAHAPMAKEVGRKIHLAYRWLVKKGLSAVALTRPWGNEKPMVLDHYRGSPYDGGYTDIAEVSGRLNIIYYLGNPRGEPSIESCLLPPL